MDPTALRPIFLFSPPRAGSTLVQRVLAAHGRVNTVSEPWLLLPLLSPLQRSLPAPGPRDPLIAEALDDFCGSLPRGRDDYRAGVREMALELYAKAAGTRAGYFVDKTPLYHLIVDEIAATFPEAKLVFLWRNPLSLVASAVELWDAGRWEVNRHPTALFRSIADLVPAYQRHRERGFSVRFEDLVGDEGGGWEGLMEYLDLTLEPGQLEAFSAVRLAGHKGDPSGTRRYSALSTEPVSKWKRTVRNPVRREWCRRYLHWIGSERLAVMGYDLDGLLTELAELRAPRDGAASDLVTLGAALARDLAKARIPPHSGGPSVSRLLLDA